MNIQEQDQENFILMCKPSRRAITEEEKIARQIREGTGRGSICHRLMTSPKRVFRVNQAIFNGQPIPKPLPMGRPPKVREEVIDYVDTSTLEDPLISGHHLSAKIAENLGVVLSPATINAIRNSLKFRFKRPRQRQALTPKHIKARQDFAREQLQPESAINWSNNTVVSDESRFCLCDDSRRVWVK